MNTSHRLLAEKYIADVLPVQKIVTEKFKSQEITPEQWVQWVMGSSVEEDTEKVTENELA